MNIQIVKGQVPVASLSDREHEILMYCLTAGDLWCAFIDGELEACWGIIPPSFMADHAYLWMWNLPLKHPLIVARYSRRIISALLDRYDYLQGHCTCGSASIRWLQWLGGNFGSPVNGLIPFEIRRR